MSERINEKKRKRKEWKERKKYHPWVWKSEKGKQNKWLENVEIK